jgi:hypothetical protein
MRDLSETQFLSVQSVIAMKKLIIGCELPSLRWIAHRRPLHLGLPDDRPIFGLRFGCQA